MKLQLLLSVVVFLGLLFLLIAFNRSRRNRLLASLIAPSSGENREQRLQQLKHHHEAEMVLQKDNLFLHYFRKIDGSMSIKMLLILFITVFIMLINYVFQLELSRNTLLLSSLFSLIVVIVVPERLRRMLVARRVKKLSAEIPWLIDLLAICVQCGMSLEGAFAFISQKMTGINPDFTPFLERLVKRTEVSGLAEALKRFLIELPSQENRMLCASLLQSMQYGSSVYEQLITLAREIREFQLLSLEEKIGSLGAKMSVPLILFFMFPVVIIVAAPGVMRIFGNE